MVIFRIIRYFIELFVRINLITGNNGHHFVWVIIYLATTEFLLRYKKPHLLFLLQCMHVLKRGLCSHRALYHSSNSYFKHKLNVLLKPLKEEFSNKTPQHFLQLINPVAYFFTKTAGFEDNINDDSDDEGSNPDEESQHGGNEENMEEISDFEYGKESEGAIGINIDMSEASSDSTSMLRTPQKRKAEAMVGIDIKRSRSTEETENFKHPSSLHLELKTKTKDNEKNNTSLPGQSSSSDIKDGTSAISNNRLIEGCDQATSRKRTHEEIEQYPPKSVKSIFLGRFQVSQTRSEDPCGNESQDSMRETVKLSSTPESPSQNPLPEKRLLEKSVSISPLPQDSDLLSTKIFPTDKKDHIPRETKSPTPLPSSIFVPFDYHSRSEDTCHTESRDSISSNTTTDTRRSTSQDTDNKLEQIVDSKSGVTEENSRKSIKSPQKNLNTASSFLDSSTGIENPNRRFDNDIRTIHSPDNISEVCENFPENIGTVRSHRPSRTPRDINSKIIAAVTKEFFQKSEEKNCEVANNQAREENTAESEKSSAVCADQKELANNTIESAESCKTFSKCIHPWDRPGCSTDPEYISSFPCECNERPEDVLHYRTYPGLSLQPLRVKKDARYQKKFYKQKKEIVFPIKLGKIIRWVLKVSKDLSHNVPGVPDSDEEKLPLDIYHELAQELVQGFMIAYNNTKKEKSKSLRDKDKNSTEGKQKKNKRAKTGYIKSSFQEESPSSDDSPESPIKASNTTAAISRLPSETNLSMISISPIKPIGKVSPRVVVQAINWQPPLIDLENNEPESNQLLHQMNEEEISNCGFINMNVCDIAYEEIVIPDAENVCKISVVKSLSQGKESSSSFQMGGIIAKAEEKNQQSEASEAELLRLERTGIDSESQSETQNVISRHPCKDIILKNLLDQPISKTIEEREFARNFSDNILANLERLEDPSSSETSNRNNFPEMAVDEQSKILETPKVSLPQEEISAPLCFENTSEDEQRAILESFKQPFSEKLNQNYFRQISADNQCEILESSSSEENLTIHNIEEMFEVEQLAIMESLGLIKQSDDLDDRGNQFFSTEYIEIPPEINIYEDQNVSEEKPITCSSTGHEISDTELREEKGFSSIAEIPSMDENITDSLKPTTEVELRDQNICLPSGLTQLLTIINVRGNADMESEHKETCSLLSSEEIKNIEENQPSCSSRRDSSSEKSLNEQKNLPLYTELESAISPIFNDSADEDNETFIDENVIPRQPCKDVMLRNLLDRPISETIEEREFARNFSDNILANLERLEGPSSEASNKNFPEMEVDDQSKILETPEESPPEEEISVTLCFEDTSEDACSKQSDEEKT